MSRIHRKKETISILKNSSISQLQEKLEPHEPMQLVGPLFSALCHPEETVRWHAVHAFSYVVPRIAEENLENARIVMRRFLWSLNDESGGIGWGSPESMAMIMCKSRVLREEYLHMLISYMRGDGELEFQDGNYLELPLLQRGLLWGIGRLLQQHADELAVYDITEDIKNYLKSPDHHVVALALWVLSFLPEPVSYADVESFFSNEAEVQLYLDDDIVTVQFSELARKLVNNFP